MKQTKLLLLLAILALILSVSLVIACGDDDDDDDDDDDTTEDDDDVADDDDATECGPEELCANAVACEWFAAVEDCTPWYDNDAACLDMDAYIACNCDCLEADAECTAWETCGTDCYNNLCV